MTTPSAAGTSWGHRCRAPSQRNIGPLQAVDPDWAFDPRRVGEGSQVQPKAKRAAQGLPICGQRRPDLHVRAHVEADLVISRELAVDGPIGYPPSTKVRPQ